MAAKDMTDDGRFEQFMRLLNQRDQRRTGVSTPRDVFRLSATCPIVATFVKLFERGDITWDQALYSMIVNLSAQKDELIHKLTKEELLKPRVIVVGKDADLPKFRQG